MWVRICYLWKIAGSPCSNDGWAAPTKALFGHPISITTWMNSPSDSTVARLPLGESCSIACFSRLPQSDPSQISAFLHQGHRTANHNIWGVLEPTDHPKFVIDSPFFSFGYGLAGFCFVMNGFRNTYDVVPVTERGWMSPMIIAVWGHAVASPLF